MQTRRKRALQEVDGNAEPRAAKSAKKNTKQKQNEDCQLADSVPSPKAQDGKKSDTHNSPGNDKNSDEVSTPTDQTSRVSEHGLTKTSSGRNSKTTTV
jgi:hypothetical protein